MKSKNKVILFILSIITSVGIIFNPIDTMEAIKFNYSSQVLSTSIIAILVYLLYLKKYNNTKRRKSFKILSIVFSLILIFGYSIHTTSSFKLVFDNIEYIALSIIKFIGYYNLINLLLNIVYEYLISLEIKEFKENKLIKKFKDNPFKFSIITLTCFYIIYLIAYYPGVVGYDPSYQIREFMGIPNFYTEGVHISGNTLITAFNPVLHTILIGSFFKFGVIINNVNFGIFLYTLIQMSFMIFTLSYSIKFMYEEKVPIKIILFILGIYVFVPVFPFYSLSAFKDTYFALFFVLYIIYLYKLIKYNYTKADLFKLIFISSMLCLFRNNGILTFLLSVPFFLIIKKNQKYIMITIFSVLAVFFTYNGILTITKVSPTSKREVLSIPFQQISALVVNKEDIITDEDKEIINKIIDYSVIKEKYNKELSDPIKNTYRLDATNKELIDFFRVWLKYFAKEPRIYLEASINNIYGYYYPDKQNWYFYHMKYNVLNENGFDYHYNNLSVLRDILYGYGEGFSYVPVLNLMVNVGFITWIYLYLIGHIISSNKKRFLLLLLPAFSIILASTLGPVNTYYRYVIPYSFSLPVLLALIYINTKKSIFIRNDK